MTTSNHPPVEFNGAAWLADLVDSVADPGVRSRQSPGLVVQRGGTWTPQWFAGPPPAKFESLAAEAIDRETSVRSESITATPVPIAGTAAVLIIPSAKVSDAAMTQIAGLIAPVWTAVFAAGATAASIEQLTTVLRAAAAWQRLDDDESLLNSLAQCVCQSLRCDRATVFLWDRRRGRLIGRPAIGIDGGQLEVEDDAGIVGEVLQSGEAQFFAIDEARDRVNRRVDERQKFRTDSLLAVPLVDPHGDTIGVLEAINAISGRFAPADEATLTLLATHAAAAIEGQKVRGDLRASRDRLIKTAAAGVPLIGNHPSINALRGDATKIAGTDLSVLIRGENGTGKEVLASHIHYHSPRAAGPLITVNCAAIVESLIESELFGHEKGSFTDASADRVGKFEAADGGTLFLDEIGDMSLAGQAKLLRVLEERVVVRVGGTASRRVDVRVIAATNQPLAQLIEAKRFRQDLYFRLAVVTLTLPSLSGRGQDIVTLAEHFIDHSGRKLTLAQSAVDALLSHNWPGNIRELRNAIARAAALCSGDQITATDLGLGMSGTAGRPGRASVTPGLNLADATREFQIQSIRSAIESAGGNMTAAAESLGLHRSNLYRKMGQLGMGGEGVKG